MSSHSPPLAAMLQSPATQQHPILAAAPAPASASATSALDPKRLQGSAQAAAAPGTKRPIQSCGECKRRKIKCNRTYPCGPCIIRGDQDICKEVEKNSEPSAGSFASATEVYTLTTRVASLEDQLLALQQTVASLTLASTSSSVAPPEEQGREIPRIANKAVAERTQPDEEVALMLEDFAMGHRVNRDRVTSRLNPIGGDSKEGLVSNQLEASSGLPVDHAFAFLIASGYEPIQQALAAAPDPQRSMFLVQLYFSRIEWYTKTLHQPSFMLEVQRLLELSHADGARQIRASFICCYLAVLCIALHLIEPEEQIALGYTPDQAKDLSKTMFSASQTLLFASGFLSSHSLEHLQAVVLMGVYQYNIDDADAHWSLLGSALKVAQNLGLSRLGAESETRKTKWPDAWKSFRRRETGRRVWWNLVGLDWSHATAHSATYCIHPGQNHTAFFSNVNDEDMVDGPAFINRPLEEYTESTFQIYKMHFIILYRELVDHLNTHSPASYSFILSMDLKLVKLMDSLPSYFTNVAERPDDPLRPNLIKESIFLQMMGENRLLRLHRPYLSRGYRDAKYAASKDRCVHSARSILSYIKIAGARAPEMLKNWLVLFLGFVASIVTFIDLTRVPSLETRTILREVLDLFKTAQMVSAAARNAVSLLEGLLAAEAEITQPSPVVGAKRRRIQDDSDTTDAPFTNVVNRLLLAAASPATLGEAESPVSASSSSVHASMSGVSTSGIWDFLTPNRPVQMQPELDVFLEGANSFDGTTRGADLSHLFSSDFPEFFQEYDGTL
ncbi:hypothetical protein T439DRAFT_324943 [Meredithblackwellia eburnea MCA 4105]